MSTLDVLADKVSRIQTVIDGAVALITGLAQHIRDAGHDEEKLTALAASLDASAGTLAAAVTANTLAAAEPAPTATV
jgi:hypothetical protein